MKGFSRCGSGFEREKIPSKPHQKSQKIPPPNPKSQKISRSDPAPHLVWSGVWCGAIVFRSAGAAHRQLASVLFLQPTLNKGGLFLPHENYMIAKFLYYIFQTNIYL